MKFSQKICLAFCLLFISVTINAQSIDILINQKDGIQENVKDISLMFENGMMDYFFDAGCIVSGEKISLDEDITVTKQKAVDASVNGFIDYLVIVILFLDAEKDEIIKAEWEVQNISSSKVLGKGTLSAPKVYREKEVSIQRFGMKVSNDVYSCIKRK